MTLSTTLVGLTVWMEVKGHAGKVLALSDRWIAGLLSSGAWLFPCLPVTQGAKQAGFHQISHKMEYLLLWNLKTVRSLVPMEIVGIAGCAPISLKQQLHKELCAASGGLEATLWSHYLQVQVWCGYQQRCLDTGKLGDVQRLQTQWTPAHLPFPGDKWDAALSSGHPHRGGMSKFTTQLPANRRLIWNRWVWLAPPTVSANLRVGTGAGAHARGTLSASSPWIQYRCYSNDRRIGTCCHRYMLRTCLFFAGVYFWWAERFAPSSRVAGMSSVSDKKPLPFSWFSRRLFSPWVARPRLQSGEALLSIQ